MKRRIPALLALLLLFGCAAAEVDEANAVFGEYGRVTAAEVTEAGAVLTAEGYYGYHMDAGPSVTLRVTISPAAEILSVEPVAMKDQTPGFGEMVTAEYLRGAYVGQTASETMDADVVAGASLTSRAALYAVRAAAHYAASALGYAADTSAADKVELAAVYPAEYETIVSDYQPDTKKIGQILYAANGKAADGTEVVALKVKGAAKVSQKGSAGTGWTSATPNPFTMIVVIDRATDRPAAWKILVDGTNQPEYFKVPAEKIDAYKTVAITDETVFDEFMDGIVLTMEFEKTQSEDGPVITGTSIVYTGKTQQGTFSSQIVRNCFRAAAAFYVNAAK